MKLVSKILPPLFFCLGLSAPPGEPPLAFVHVTVVPMDSERSLADQTVVVAGGRIVEIGPASEVQVPAGSRILDGSGRYLLPGFFDTHVHRDEAEPDDSLALYVARGVTTVQSLHGSPFHLELRRRIAAGEALGPRFLTTGPTTATEGVDSPEKASRFVAAQKAAGYDAVKMYGDGSNSMTLETYRALVRAAHASGLRVTGHAPRNLPFGAVLEAGQDSIDHMEEIVYTAEPIVAVIQPLLDLQFGRIDPEQAGDALAALGDLRPALAPAVAELARRAGASGLAVTPTLVAFETIWRQTTDYPALLEMPELRYVSAVTRAEWGPQLNGYRSSWSDRLDAMDAILGRSLELQKTLVRGFHDAGVPILAGTDAPLEFVVPGFSLHRELALLVESGLSPFEALRAATAVAASELGLGAETGTIEVGKVADLVLVEADPLADVANAGRIAGVALRGRWLDRAELEARLEALASGYQRAVEPVGRMLEAYAADDAADVLDASRGVPEADAAAAAALAQRLVNSLGYARLRDDGDAKAAVAIFRRNIEFFPDSSNAWDSFGEGLLRAGELAPAGAAYQRAAELDPDSTSASRALAWITFELEARQAPPAVLSAADRERLAGSYGERQIRLGGGGLVYQRGAGAEYRLERLSADTFALAGLPTFRLRFVLDGDRAVKLEGLYFEGHTDESPRD